MDYFTAQSITKEDGSFASPDFYRMSQIDKASTFCIALRDSPQQILYDVANHGSDAAHIELRDAMEKGIVIPSEANPGLYEVCDLEMGAACPIYAQSHIAMQIAYPERYANFFDGDFVATYNHAKMQELVDLSVSCMTNKAHPSDIYGEHEILPDKKPVGRPKSKTSEAQCGKKQEVADAWVAVEEAIAARDEYIERLKAWRTVELDKLRAAMKAIGEQYKVCEADAKEKVRVVRQVHRDLKDS